MKAYYDLHIHSALSPCGDNDMTPNNIVNMAMLNGQNIIALTDHNSCKNVNAAVQVGKAVGVCVVPGIELCTCEEIHCVCLFPAVEAAMEFDSYVASHSMQIKNRADIYGEQRILNTQDELVGIEQNLLIVGSDISIMQLPKLVESYGGICYPAHIDRDSYSVLSSLGSIPPECNFKVAEIYDRTKTEKLRAENICLDNMKILHSSDAHYLENLKERLDYIELTEISARCLIDTLKDK